VHLFSDILAQVAGWAMAPVGILTLVIGFYRYNKMRHAASVMRRDDPLKH